MFLSQLELIGFKSFAKRTKIRFHSGITGIVGPNGCGKSNLVDAIRWVMGEQKGSELRSERMEQVIFNGSESRRPLGMAEVNLTIENNRELLPSDYAEITVTRRLYRNGESEYILNRQKTRLKDIVDLFLDTGLGANSYGLISPDMVSRILTEDLWEKRSLFEEAAGIAKYKLRVRTAQRRLDTVNDNLERLIDILTEVEKNVRSLKRQYNAAKRYEELRAKSEELGTALLVLERNELVDVLDQVHTQLNDLKHKLGRRREEKRAAEESLGGISARISATEAEIAGIRADWEEHNSQAVNLENRLLLIDEKERNAVSQRERSLESIERSEQSKKFLGERVSLHNRTLQSLESEIAGIRRDVSDSSADFAAAEQAHQEIRGELEIIEARALGLKATMGTLERDSAARRAKIAAQEERRLDLVSENESTELDIKRFRERREELEREKQSAETEYTRNETEILGFKAKLENYKDALKGAEGRRAKLEISLEKKKSQLQFLQSLLESGGGIPEGAVNLLAGKASGILESVGNLIGVKSKYSAAVETALGEAAHYIISETRGAGAKALDNLKARGGGRATVISLDSRFPLGEAREISGYGILGTAEKFVECEARYRELISYLLGNTLVVESWDVALKARDSGKWPGLIVTLEGEAVGEFTLCGGKSGEKYPAVGRKKQADEIAGDIESIREKIVSATGEIEATESAITEQEGYLGTAEARLREAGETLSRIRGETASMEAGINALVNRLKAIESELGRIAAEKSSAEADLTEIEGKRETVSSELSDVESVLTEKRGVFTAQTEALDQRREELHRQQLKLAGKEGELEKLKSEVSLVRSRQAELEEEIRRLGKIALEIEGRISGFGSEREQLREELAECRRLRDEWKAKLGGAEENQAAVKEEYRIQADKVKAAAEVVEQLAEELSSHEVQAAELKSRISAKDDTALDKYGVDLEAVDLAEEPDRGALEAESNKLKRKLESIGPVNLLALQEYGKQKERHDFLQAEYDDIVKSKEELLETITKTNAKARSQFKSVFRQVADNFRLIFQDLFEGGEGELSLGEGDPLEAEILLKANPAGKKLVNLNQLSGGEKTMTAVALIFALYQVKPSPFCVLDEVDAPLDDANVKRFLKLINRFSSQTQFILITHNKVTMESCDYLYGITMEEEGLSKVISVEIDSAARIAEAG